MQGFLGFSHYQLVLCALVSIYISGGTVTRLLTADRQSYLLDQMYVDFTAEIALIAAWLSEQMFILSFLVLIPIKRFLSFSLLQFLPPGKPRSYTLMVYKSSSLDPKKTALLAICLYFRPISKHFNTVYDYWHCGLSLSQLFLFVISNFLLKNFVLRTTVWSIALPGMFYTFVSLIHATVSPPRRTENMKLDPT